MRSWAVEGKFRSASNAGTTAARRWASLGERNSGKAIVASKMRAWGKRVIYFWMYLPKCFGFASVQARKRMVVGSESFAIFRWLSNGGSYSKIRSLSRVKRATVGSMTECDLMLFDAIFWSTSAKDVYLGNCEYLVKIKDWIRANLEFVTCTSRPTTDFVFIHTSTSLILDTVVD